MKRLMTSLMLLASILTTQADETKATARPSSSSTGADGAQARRTTWCAGSTLSNRSANCSPSPIPHSSASISVSTWNIPHINIRCKIILKLHHNRKMTDTQYIK